MAPGLKRNKSGKKDNVVNLITDGKLSGQFSQGRFRELYPLVSVSLSNIASGEFPIAGHISLGFTKTGRHILSYTKKKKEDVEYSDTESVYYKYFLHWWEFNMHSLKLVQRVKLFAWESDSLIDESLYLSVSEWPNDASKIVVSGFSAHSTSTDQLMVNMDNQAAFCHFVSIAPNPPSKPCGHCWPVPPASRMGECLEHGYVFHTALTEIFGTVYQQHFTFQPALQMKKDRVMLLKVPDYPNRLVALAVYLCPAGQQQSRSSQVLYTERAAPLSGQPSAMSTSTSSHPSSSSSTLPQGSTEARQSHPSNVSPPAASSSNLLSHSQEADLDKPGYLDYRRLHYHLPQPGAGEQDAEPSTFSFTDLEGRERKLVTGPHDGQSLCVEQLALDLKHFLHDLFVAKAVLGPQELFRLYNYVILEVCAETDIVLMDVCLLLLLPNEELTEHQAKLQVSWDLNTGLCRLIGAGDLAEILTDLGGILRSHRESCVNTVTMECPIPENSSRRVNVMNEERPERVLADTDRSTCVVL